MSKSGVSSGAQGIQTLVSTSWNASVSQQSASIVSTSAAEPEVIVEKKKKAKNQPANKSAPSIENGLEQLSISVSYLQVC